MLDTIMFAHIQTYLSSTDVNPILILISMLLLFAIMLVIILILNGEYAFNTYADTDDVYDVVDHTADNVLTHRLTILLTMC